ncbi:uncharacterized protein LOC102207734 [Pundamilia nyererei]|uniref:Uncharacterized protein LOC102207734 n=1 Tax=Pundamilia nyererei TaxID=303518 RepID=A0A9Y3VBT6_9CICH|nr:PREDICTED: uncharacterized protein LOC102207734 [Pundamilia nyererei]
MECRDLMEDLLSTSGSCSLTSEIHHTEADVATKQEMGQTLSPEQEEMAFEGIADMLSNVLQLDELKIDSSLQRFSGLNSAEELNNYRDHVLYSGELNQVASIVREVGNVLGGLSKVPHAVGLGALIISLALDVVAKSLNKETMGTAEMLERVFAQEKAKEVRDLMHEYLKRMQINLRDPQLQLSDTRLIEIALSAQLTRLKNSMLIDEHMDTQFLKQWVNGAAFHTQMLIHQARLESAGEPDGSRAVRAAGIYQQDMNRLMEKIKTLMRNRDDSQNANKIIEILFSKPQITWTRDYFSKLQANIPALVRQNADFVIKT